MKQFKKLLTAFAILFLATLVLTACGGQDTPKDKVRLQLNWIHESEFVGYYVANDKGFYAAENLEVSILPGGPGKTSAGQALADGSVEFSVFSSNDLKTYYTAGKVPGVAVMNIYQVSPRVFFAKAEKGIRTPKDMANKTVIFKNAGWSSVMQTTLKNAGVDPALVTEKKLDNPNNLDWFYKDDVDVFIGFVNSEVAEVRSKNYDVNLIFASEYAATSFDGIIVTRQDFSQQSPDVVSRFMRATLKGWYYAIEHPSEAAQVLTKWQPDKSPDFQSQAMRGLIPLVDTGQVPIGWMDDKLWAKTKDIEGYSEQKLTYSNKFVEENRY